MPPVRLVHCADVHLDTAVASRHDGRRRRVADAVRATFDALVDLCLRERVHGLLIAGDLLDGQRLAPGTAAFLAARLTRLADAGVTTFLAAGNHDPGPALRAALPPGCCELFDRAQPRAAILRDEQGAPLAHVVGCGHEGPRDTEDLPARIADAAGELPADGLPRVALVHTQVLEARGRDRHEAYAATARATLADAPVDYWALGHVHRRQVVCESPLACYPGNLQGRHRHERGPKGALLVELEGGRARARFQTLDTLRFETVTLDTLAEVTRPHDLQLALRAALADTRRERVVHVELSGACPLAASLGARDAREELAEQMADELGVFALDLDVRALRAPLDLERARDGSHVLAHALRLLDELRADPGGHEHLLPEHLASLEATDPDARAETLRALLEGLDERAALRLDPPT